MSSLNTRTYFPISFPSQLKKKTSSKRDYSNSSYPRNYSEPSKLKEKGPRDKEKEKEKEKFSSKESSKNDRVKETKCFKCGYKGHYVSECPNKSDSNTSISKEEVLPYEGELLLVRRLLGSQQKELEQSQRENLFRTRCKAFENTYSLIVDSGSSCNCCSSRMVEKLALTIIPHPKPYKIQWIKEDEEIIVKEQVSIPISIGNYEETVLCDVVPIDVGHVLLAETLRILAARVAFSTCVFADLKHDSSLPINKRVISLYKLTYDEMLQKCIPTSYTLGLHTLTIPFIQTFIKHLQCTKPPLRFSSFHYYSGSRKALLIIDVIRPLYEERVVERSGLKTTYQRMYDHRWGKVRVLVVAMVKLSMKCFRVSFSHCPMYFRATDVVAIILQSTNRVLNIVLNTSKESIEYKDHIGLQMGCCVSCFLVLGNVDEDLLWEASLGYFWHEMMEVVDVRRAWVVGLILEI
ncbi:hypothetical protein V8G54_023058 [Vigna mungo]|uniref:CCHC-type domain-containing protein n=1 Tax=Vigna mungo TaxID=3915 RepID=A0AAQ3RPZ0_VIGMU